MFPCPRPLVPSFALHPLGPLFQVLDVSISLAKVADVEQELGQGAEAERGFREALLLADDPGRAVRVLLSGGRLLELSGANGEAVSAGERESGAQPLDSSRCCKPGTEGRNGDVGESDSGESRGQRDEGVLGGQREEGEGASSLLESGPGLVPTNGESKAGPSSQGASGEAEDVSRGGGSAAGQDESGTGVSDLAGEGGGRARLVGSSAKEQGSQSVESPSGGGHRHSDADDSDSAAAMLPPALAAKVCTVRSCELLACPTVFFTSEDFELCVSRDSFCCVSYCTISAFEIYHSCWGFLCALCNCAEGARRGSGQVPPFGNLGLVGMAHHCVAFNSDELRMEILNPAFSFEEASSLAPHFCWRQWNMLDWEERI